MCGRKTPPRVQVSAAEFVLEGLHAHKKIGRNEERVFSAGEKPPKVAEKPRLNAMSRSSAGRGDLISRQLLAISRQEKRQRFS
jgi:hypothetical protein